MPDSAISISHVTKRFRLYKEQSKSLKERFIHAGRNPHSDFLALEDVSIEVPWGTTVGLLGHNGSGKSTLLKCVTGTLRPNAGTIVVRGRLAALLELGAGFHPDLTGRENVYLNGSILGFSAKEIDRIFDDIVDFSELSDFIDNQVKHYSSGMYARLAFAVATTVEPEILLIDEVLSVGDEAFARKCLDRVKRFQHEGRTILLVTHAADLVRQICDQVAVLDRGKLVAFDEPGPAVRKFRETLANRGATLEDVGLVGKWDLTKEIRFTDLRVDYPDDSRPYAMTGGRVRVRAGWEANRDNDDVVFAIAVYDLEGRLVFSTNTEILATEVDVRTGTGTVTFDIDGVPLLDGSYPVSLGIHNRDGGTEYDHRDQEIRFDVVSGGRSVGSTALPMTSAVANDSEPAREASL